MPRERTQRSAHKVERRSRRGPPIRTLEQLGNRLAERALAACAQAGQAQRPQRQRGAMPAPLRIDIDKFEASPAKIGDHAVCLRKRADHTVCAGDRFFLAAQQAGCHPQCANLVEEFRTVDCIARRRRRHHFDVANALEIEQCAIPRKARQRRRRSPRTQLAVFRHALAEPRGHLFVVQHIGRARRTAIDDEPHGVRTDIDDRAGGHIGRGAGEAGHLVQLAIGYDAGRYGHAGGIAPRRRASLGTLLPLVSAAPRPESEGLVMK